DMQKMVGKPLDNSEQRRLRDRLTAELGEKYGVDDTVARGEPQHVKVIYYAYKLPWLPFRDPLSFITYHQKQGTSFSLILPIDLGARFSVLHDPGNLSISSFHKHAPSKRLTFGAANSADELIERYKGFRFGYEQVSVGTDRLGIKLEYTMFGERWQAPTELASRQSPGKPDLYRSRRSVEPSVAFAFSPSLYATA